MRKHKSRLFSSVSGGLPLLLGLLVAFSHQTLADNKWEDDISIICPQECACKQQPFNDLSVARWVQGVGQPIETSTQASSDLDYQDTAADGAFLKTATCYLRQNTDSKEFFASLPADLQVLVLLYLGTGTSNTTIETSHISVLSELETLEIRGSASSGLFLVFDEPLSHIRHLNLEAIELLGVEEAKRRPNFETYNPSDHFDYVPESEKTEYNVSLKIEEEVEVVPYEVYLMQKKRAKTVTFYGWESLEILRIHDCHLDELYWEIFDGLEALQHLSLEHNQIKIVPPFAFFGALHIKTLSLARNFILDLHYRALAGLLELEQLDLSFNNLTKLSEMTFPPFPSLETLDLRHNPIQFIFPATFGVMNGTRSIFMGSPAQALDLRTDRSFENLPKLQRLVLLNVTSEALTPETFLGLVSLERLSVRGSLKRVEFDSFADKPGLHELSLRDCQIEEISMDTLFGIKHLEVVDLANNLLSSIPHGLFDEQAQLREIYLENNLLSELPNNFFSLPALKLVRLGGNPWKCSCEMVSWKQGVTNAVRVQKPGTMRCELDEVLKKMVCETQEGTEEYVFDSRMSPRCADSGRSVYYAIRKDLRCSTRKHREKEASKHRAKKMRIAEKSVKHFAEQASNLRWNNAPPTQALNEPYDFNKIQREKEQKKNLYLKVFHTVMRENDIPKPAFRGKFKAVEATDNRILSNSYEF